MNEDFENIEEGAEYLVNRFNKMLKNNGQYYFDVFEFESIIDYFISKREYRKAQTVVEYAITLHSNAFSIMSRHSQILIKLSQPIKALRLIKKLLKLESSNEELHFLKGVVYCTLGNIRSAKRSFNKSISFSIESKVDLLYNISIALQEVGRYDFAIEYLKQAYNKDNQDIAVIYDLAFCYEKIDNNDLGIEFYKKYISKNPFSEIAWYNIAIIYEKLNNYNLAIDAFEYAIAIDNEYGLAYFHKGRCLFEQSKHKESIDTFKEYLNISPNDPLSLLYIGESYYEINKPQTAITFFDKAFHLDNSYNEALYLKALALIELDDLHVASEIIKQAIKLSKKNTTYLLLLGMIYSKLNLLEDAENVFKKTIQIDPYIPDVWIEYSKLNFSKNNISKTISILSESFKYLKEDAEINYRLAAYLAKNKEFDSAGFHLKLAITENKLELYIFDEIYEGENKILKDIIKQHEK